MKCDYIGCDKQALYRVQASFIDDKNACEEHAKGLPVHWTFEKEQLEEPRNDDKRPMD